MVTDRSRPGIGAARSAGTDPEVEKRRIVTGSRVCAKLLLIGAGFALATVGARLLADGDNLHVGMVDLPVSYAWVVLAALTVAHVFNAVFLTHRILAYADGRPGAKHAQDVFDEVSSHSNPFVFGLVSRALPRREGGVYHPMSRSDPSAWVAYVAVVVLVAALLPWHRSGHSVAWASGPALGLQLSVTLLVVAANWWAGSVWLITLSRLQHTDTDADAQEMAAARERQRRYRVEEAIAVAQEKYLIFEGRFGYFGRNELKYFVNELDWKKRFGGLTRIQAYYFASKYLRLIKYPMPEVSDSECILNDHHEYATMTRESGLCATHRRRLAAGYRLVRSRYPDVSLPSSAWFLAGSDPAHHLELEFPRPRRDNRPRDKTPWWKLIS